MTEPEELPYDLELLCEVFRGAEKQAARFMLGLEAEKFGLLASGDPLPYEGEAGVEGLFALLAERGWQMERERAHGPVISLRRDGASVTLEPAAQVELSGTPAVSVHELWAELSCHLEELGSLAEPRGISFLHLGFHPLARHDELPWVPKLRYPIMRQYLPKRGSRGLDMMTRTATVQVNLDYESEADAMRRLVLLLKVTPFLQAMTLNAPFIEGRTSSLLSERLDVWLNMDPARSGLIESLWNEPSPRYRHYAEWALDAGMFLFKRGEQLHLNTGQSFRDFLRHGFEGQRATLADWKLHLGTLFPEVRLKTTLEVRGVDALPPALSMAVPAFLAGLAYDARASDAAFELLEPLTYEAAVELQHRVSKQGLRARYLDGTVQQMAIELLRLAEDGLRRRHESGVVASSEVVWLEPLVRQVESGRTPADVLLDAYRRHGGSVHDFLRQESGRVNIAR